MSIESKRIEFPSRIWFAASKEALTDSLFAPGGTASGWYEKRKGGILFRRGNGDPWFFLVANKYAQRFFVSCGKQSDGRTVYFHALSSLDEKALGMSASYSERNEIAESVWDSFKPKTADTSCPVCGDKGWFSYNPNLNPDSWPAVSVTKCPHCEKRDADESVAV